jgi:transposase
MRGLNETQDELFSYFSLEQVVPIHHPLRRIRELVDPILQDMSAEFEKIYSETGRPSIPPEQLLKALLLQTLFTIRSERLLVEQLQYNLLYRWFVGLKMSEQAWVATTFTKNRQRLLDGAVADKFFSAVIGLAERKKLVSREHFTVDGSLVHAWASLKGFQKKEDKESEKSDDKNDPESRNPTVDFRGEKRSNDTHESRTDPEAKIYTKSNRETSKLCYMGHVLMENRNGLAVDKRFTAPGYHAEPEAALDMAITRAAEGRKTLGGDKHYDQDYLAKGLRGSNFTPHVAQNVHARRHHSSIDGRTTRHAGYEVSQRKRKRIEEIFGWLKTVGLMRRPMFIGMAKMEWAWTFALAVYNLVRIRNLLTPTG